MQAFSKQLLNRHLELKNVIGGGSFGLVYLAKVSAKPRHWITSEQAFIDQLVPDQFAVKMARNEDGVQDIWDEIQLLSSLPKHDRIVDFRFWGNYGDRPFLGMSK